MTRLIPMAVLYAPLIVAAGCVPSVSDRLVGEWQGSPDASAKSRISPMPEPALNVRFQPSTFEMTLVFAEKQQKSVGKWRVVEAKGDRWRVELIAKKGDNSATRLLDVVFRDDDSFTATEVGGDDRVPVLLFRRNDPAEGG